MMQETPTPYDERIAEYRQLVKMPIRSPSNKRILERLLMQAACYSAGVAAERERTAEFADAAQEICDRYSPPATIHIRLLAALIKWRNCD